MRPRARIVRKLPFSTRGIAPETVISRLNSGELLPAPPKSTPSGIQTEQALADQVQPPIEPKWLADLVRQYAWLPAATLALGIAIALLALLLAPALPLAILGLGAAAGLLGLYAVMNRILPQLAKPQVFGDDGRPGSAAPPPAAVDTAPKSPDFRIAEPGEAARPTVGTTDSVEAQRLKAAVKEMYAVDTAARAAATLPPKQPLNLSVLAVETLAALHPD
ncbi:MAG: hypothetical protein J0I90_01710, partial [Nitrosospira sp.]|nr:hypothetical protein [Nitrosospira sp.]